MYVFCVSYSACLCAGFICECVCVVVVQFETRSHRDASSHDRKFVPYIIHVSSSERTALLQRMHQFSARLYCTAHAHRGTYAVVTCREWHTYSHSDEELSARAPVESVQATTTTTTAHSFHRVLAAECSRNVHVLEHAYRLHIIASRVFRVCILWSSSTCCLDDLCICASVTHTNNHNHTQSPVPGVVPQNPLVRRHFASHTAAKRIAQH